MKKTKILSLALIFVCLACVVTFAGCGGLSVKTIQDSMQSMNDKLAEYSTILVKDDDLHNTINYYQISYGEDVDGLVSKGEENYKDLKIYNSIFSIAMSYIEENHVVITNLTDEETNDATKAKLNGLNESITSFTSEIGNFVEKRNSLEKFFADYSDTVGEADKLVKLREFKREYANFVNKSVLVSTNLSDAVVATGVLDDLDNVLLIKNYVCNKILKVFNEFFINEMGDFNWSESDNSATKEEINTIIQNLETQFGVFQQIVNLKAENLKELTVEDLNAIKQEANNFMTEADNFFEALKGLDISNLATNYLNDIDEYVKDNLYAKVYLDKVSQFVEETLPSYLIQFNLSVSK